MQPCTGQLQIANRSASGQVPANEDGILCFNCNIEFPVAKWWIRQRKFRPRRGRLRRRSAGQTDRNQIDILQEMTVRHRDIAGNRGREEWSRHLEVCVRARRQRIVSRDEHALRLQLQIKSRLSQFGKGNPATDCERATGQLATKTLQRYGVAREIQSRVQVLKSRKRRIRESRDVDSYIARAA